MVEVGNAQQHLECMQLAGLFNHLCSSRIRALVLSDQHPLNVGIRQIRLSNTHPFLDQAIANLYTPTYFCCSRGYILNRKH